MSPDLDVPVLQRLTEHGPDSLKFFAPRLSAVLPGQPEEQPPLPNEDRMLAKAPRPEFVLPEPLEGRVTPAADAGNGIKLVPAKHDYGKVMEGEARTHVFKVKCPPDATLALGRLYSPCPCIRVTVPKRQLAAGEDAEVEVTLHSLTLEGKKSFPFCVDLLQPEKKVLRVDVSIEVERVPAKVLVKPGTLHLGSVRGAKATEVRLYNLMKRPLRLGEVTCSLEGAEVSMPEGKWVEPGRYATIRLEVPETGLPPGPIQGAVTVETNCPEHALVSIPVDGTALRPKHKERSRQRTLQSQ